MHGVQALSDASQRGEWPNTEVLKLEEEAFHELSVLREALLEALREHSKQGTVV